MAYLELPALSPQLLLGLTALAVLAYDSLYPEADNRDVLVGITAVGTLATLATTVFFLVAGTGLPATGGAIEQFGGQVVVDGMALFFTLIVASVTALVAVASYDYLEGHEYQAEYFALLLMAALGMTLMAVANSFATAFVSLELASLPAYAL
ncbi:MAG: NADH-quinone oxidoreductase subunit N, partial [Halobacteriales archaeon]